jgi:alkylation response protein AidB-like acyl-CoA dehydrogenase
MRWELDDEQRELQKLFGDWLAKAAPSSAVREWGDAGDPGAFETELAEQGWLSLGTSEERGGGGGGLLELALIAERFGAAVAPGAAWLATVLALPALDDARAAEAIEEGRRLALVVRSDRPIAAGDVGIGAGGLEGEVPLVLGADRADLLVVPADGGLHAVDPRADGVEVVPTRLLDRSRSAATVRLRGAASERLDADASAVLDAAAVRAAVLLAADALGAATRMRELAVEYSGQRTQFGVPIGSFQAVKHAAAEMLVREEASRSLVLYAAASVEAGLPDAAAHAAAAKAQATQAGWDTAEAALTLHGAIGYTWEHDLQLLYKRARLDRALSGGPATWNERIAEHLRLA